MKKNFATVFVVALVLSIMFSSLPLAPVQAQSGGGTGGGTFTLNVTAAMGAGSGYDRFTYVRDPNAQELSQIKFDIFFWPAPVGTAGVVVHSGVGTGSYVLRTLGPNERYSIDVKQPPEGGDYATNLWFGNFIWGIGSTNGQPPQPLPNGSTQNIQLKFRYNFNSLETLGGGYAQIPTVFKGEIVDYKGSLVRSLTADEKAQTSFEVVSFNGVTNVDVPAGVIIAGGKLSPPANKLETTYMLGVEKKSAAGCVRCYRVINITPPSGYVLRYIRSITSGQGLGMGGDFAPPWLLSQEVRNEYKDFLSPSDLQVPTMEFMLSFAPAFGSSLAKVQDRMVYVPGGDSGLALVQRFINTYGKWQGNDPATDLTPGYLEFHSDGRWAKNAVEPVKPFPRGAKAAYFGGKAYLFINAGQQLMVYDISNPTSPTLKRTINVKDILAAGGRPVTSADLQDFTTVNNAPPTFADVVVLDNSPYILVSVGWQGEVNGVAALKVDSASASLTATSDLVYLGKGYSTTGLFGYKGGGGKYYFVSDLAGSKTCKTKLCSGTSDDVYAIYSIGESGDVVVEQTLINRSSSFVTYPLQGMGVVGFAATGAKTYVFGKITVAGATYQIPTTASLKAFDITSPASVQEVATLALPSAESTISVDGAGKRMYIQTPVTGYGNKPAPVDVYDISSSPLSFKAVGSYSDACVMSGLSEQSDVIKEIKKLYNIPESQAVIATGGCSSNGSKLKMDGNKGMVTIPGSYLSLPGATVFNAAENQNYNAFNTQYSSYGAPWYMVFVDLSDLAKPKILGIASARQISVRSTGGMVGAPEEGDIIYSFNYNGNLSPVVVHRNRYVYRTLHRTADVFEFTNIQATTPPPPPTTPPPTGGGPIVKPPTFIFQNLLNMFKRILLFKIGG